MDMPTDHLITITVDTRTGDFTYAPTHVRARPGETITFTSPTGPFEVMFKKTTPGDKVHLHNPRPADPPDVYANKMTVNVRGVHQYAAAVYDPAGNQVFIDTGCGDVGVGD